MLGSDLFADDTLLLARSISTYLQPGKLRPVFGRVNLSSVTWLDVDEESDLCLDSSKIQSLHVVFELLLDNVQCVYSLLQLICVASCVAISWSLTLDLYRRRKGRYRTLTVLGRSTSRLLSSVSPSCNLIRMYMAKACIAASNAHLLNLIIWKSTVNFSIIDDKDRGINAPPRTTARIPCVHFSKITFGYLALCSLSYELN